MESQSWSFTGIWNASLDTAEARKYEPRDYLWASELGKPYSEVFLKLKGIQPTNPPNARSLRKFEAGNIWEWIVKLLLMRAGILQPGSQERVTFAYDQMLLVSGRPDFIAGGKPDWELAKVSLGSLPLPEVFKRAYDNIVAHFAEHYPGGLDEKILEIKSVSAFMFEGLERTQKPLRIHRLQAYHYLKATGMRRADIVYICRDDCRMIEFPVFIDSFVEDEYRAWIEGMSEYWFRGEMPPIEKPVVFDEELGKFSKNNQVAWSPYLTMLYGLESQAEFDEKYKPMADRWNRVMTRIKKGAKMTANNEAALAEIAEAGFDVEAIKSKLIPDDDESSDSVA